MNVILPGGGQMATFFPMAMQTPVVNNPLTYNGLPIAGKKAVAGWNLR